MAEAVVALSDEQLVALTVKGEVSAFNDLVARWEGSLFSFVYRYLGDAEEAKDICQEAFVRAYTHLDGFRGQAKFSSWLYQIALNLCRSKLRRQKAHPTVSIDDRGDGQPLWALPDERATPAEAALVGERAMAVRGALAALPEAQREVIILKEYHGLKFREIAEILDTPESTVKSRLYHGLETLAQVLGHLQAEGI
ncbi:MAG: RNA polymerase sigma factor [Acidobacteriota bacterium]